MKYTNNELQELTEKWSKDRLITINGKAETQVLKLVEEVGEIAAAIVRGNKDEAKDGIGDACVVLTNLSKLLGTDINECWNIAYNEIKDRKGKLLPNGNFVKEQDLVNN